MKQFFSLLIVFSFFSFRFADGIYTQPIKTLEGKKVDLSQYKGKKILFVIVPHSASDTTVSLEQLSALQTKYESSLVVIGVLSEESGFKKGDEDKLKKLYKDQKSNFILTEGMKVKKGETQTPLFQ